MIKFILFLILALPLSARTFTSSDGKKLNASYVSGGNGEVTLKRASDGKLFTLKISRLSKDDQQWISRRIADDKPNLVRFRPEQERYYQKAKIQKKLESIEIKSISLDAIPLNKAIDQLMLQCRIDDEDPSPRHRGLNFLIVRHPNGQQNIPLIKPLKLKKVSAKVVLDYILRETNHTYKVDSFSVIIIPPGIPKSREKPEVTCHYQKGNTGISTPIKYAPRPILKQVFYIQGWSFQIDGKGYHYPGQGAYLVIPYVTKCEVFDEILDTQTAVVDLSNKYIYLRSNNSEHKYGTWHVIYYGKDKPTQQPKLTHTRKLISEARLALKK